jgi:DNA helicase-2/ATP-dependent DNA helicase PcrA
MNLVKHELGFSKMDSRFPTKSTCLAIYSRAVNAEMALDDALRNHYPWCAGWDAQLRKLFATYVEAKQAQSVGECQRSCRLNSVTIPPIDDAAVLAA